MKNKSAIKFRQAVEATNHDYKTVNRIYWAAEILIILAGFIFWYVTKETIALYITVIAALGFMLVFTSHFTSLLVKMKKERFDEFIIIISYFQTYIFNHNNVYQSFRKVTEFASPWMKNALDRLLIEIDSDKSVQPYVNFSLLFEEKIVYNIMLSIFQMVDQGESGDNLQQFVILFNQISQNHHEELKKSKEKSFDIINVFPMISAALITVVLSLVLISVMGELVNVI